MTTTKDRLTDSTCVATLLHCPAKAHRYLHLCAEANSLHSCNLAGWDYEQVVHKRSKHVLESPLLIPELLEALRRLGREVPVGEEGAWANQGHLPESAGISWQGVYLSRGETGHATSGGFPH